jgi:hypothetical protein
VLFLYSGLKRYKQTFGESSLLSGVCVCVCVCVCVKVTKLQVSSSINHVVLYM